MYDLREDLPDSRAQDQGLSACYYHTVDTHLRTTHTSPLLLTRHRQFSRRLHLVSTPHSRVLAPISRHPSSIRVPACSAASSPEMALNVLLEYQSSIECLSILIGAILVLQLYLPSLLPHTACCALGGGLVLYLEHRKRRVLSTPSTLLGQLFTRAEAPVNDVCPFCRDDFVDPVRISCSHTFCSGCARTIFAHEDACPLCGQKPTAPAKDNRNSSLFLPSCFWCQSPVERTFILAYHIICAVAAYIFGKWARCMGMIVVPLLRLSCYAMVHALPWLVSKGAPLIGRLPGMKDPHTTSPALHGWANLAFFWVGVMVLILCEKMLQTQ